MRPSYSNSKSVPDPRLGIALRVKNGTTEFLGSDPRHCHLTSRLSSDRVGFPIRVQ